jgi:hypothetical protein
MKKKNVEFVGVVVKIDGKKKVINKNRLYFKGWEFNDLDYSDSGVDLDIYNDKGTKIIGKLNL